MSLEFTLFGEAPPTWVALLVTVVVYALFYFGGRQLGRYEPLPEDVEPTA